MRYMNISNFKEFWKGGNLFHFEANVTLPGGRIIHREFMLSSQTLEDGLKKAHEQVDQEFRYRGITHVDLYQI